jgi:hypothetical protein
LCGLPAALVVLFLGYMGVISLLVFLSVPQLIFYYVVLRLPMFLGLVLALWIAQYVRLKNAKPQRVRLGEGRVDDAALSS